MKFKFSKNAVIAVLFLYLIFIMLGGTCYGAYLHKGRYISIYSGYLSEGTSFNAIIKAMVLTTYDSLSNVNDMIFARNTFINLYGLTQRVVGSRCINEQSGEVSKVVKLDDGSVTLVMDKENDLPQKVAKISALNEKLKSDGIEMLYIQLPFKINKQSKDLPVGVYDYSNENADAVIQLLKNGGVDTYDLREEVLNEKLDYSSLFFRTDHHWLPETGLWAAKKIAGKLNSGFGFTIDMSLLEKSNFTETTYKKQFLGSMGKRMGVYYAGTDDFSLILPRFETDMSCFYHRRNGTIFGKSGSFEDTWIFTENLKKDYFNINSYATYSGGDYSLLEFRNNRIAGKKILMLRDSFSCVLVPFFSLAAGGELHAIDPRYYKGSITDYVEKFKPDLVLMLYNPGVLKEMSFFTY